MTGAIFISVTRLRIRSVFYMPAFALHAYGTVRQVRRATGFRQGALLPDRGWTFWTMTAWDGEASMRAYMLAGAHRSAMPHLLNWCDEASLVHWEQQDADLPVWDIAYQRLCSEGRASKVRHPSPRHAGLAFEAPRASRAVSIQPSTRHPV